MNQDIYTITDLLGFPITSQERTNLMQGYTSLILERFFTQKLPEILTGDQLERTKYIVKTAASPEELWDKLTKEIPALSSELEDFSRMQKKQILGESYEAKLKECDSFLSSHLSPQTKQALSKTYDTYARALELLGQDDWENLYSHWHPTS